MCAYNRRSVQVSKVSYCSHALDRHPVKPDFKIKQWASLGILSVPGLNLWQAIATECQTPSEDADLRLYEFCMYELRPLYFSGKYTWGSPSRSRLWILFWKTRSERFVLTLKPWQFRSILTSSQSTKWNRTPRTLHPTTTPPPPHMLRCPHGSTRAGFNHLWRLQGILFFFLLLHWFLIWTEISFVRGMPMATSTITILGISRSTAGRPSGQPGRPGLNQHT